MERAAYVSNIQRFSVHDGPGIRTVVFLQGCPLSCRWCQNPENIPFHPVILMDRAACRGCGACLESCPTGAVRMLEQGGIGTWQDKCQRGEGCGARCQEACVFLARKLSSRPMTAGEAAEAVLRDRVVHRNSGGGVTVSGGEPLCHPRFVRELFTRCREQGLTTAVETCGHAPWSAFEGVLALTDTFLYDCKLADPQEHKHWTGVDNRLILENLEKLAAGGARVVLRVPLVPGVNDSEESFGGILDLAVKLPGVRDLHLLPFHHLGAGKYDQLDRPYTLAGLAEENEERITACKVMAEARGLRVSLGGAGFKDDKRPAAGHIEERYLK